MHVLGPGNGIRMTTLTLLMSLLKQEGYQFCKLDAQVTHCKIRPTTKDILNAATYLGDLSLMAL